MTTDAPERADVPKGVAEAGRDMNEEKSMNDDTTAAVARKAEDSTVVDPAVHQVVFENEHVRVINARAAHGWSSPMHSHPPMVVVVLGSGRQKVTWPDGSTQIVDLNPGTVVWQEHAFDHTWELLAGEVDVVLVEVKSANVAAAQAFTATVSGGTPMNGNVYTTKVIDAFRTNEGRVGAGDAPLIHHRGGIWSVEMSRRVNVVGYTNVSARTPADREGSRVR